MTKDLLVQQYNKNLAILQNYVKKGIYVQGPTPNYPLLHINNFIDALVEGKDLQSFNLNKKVGYFGFESNGNGFRVPTMRCIPVGGASKLWTAKSAMFMTSYRPSRMATSTWHTIPKRFCRSLTTTFILLLLGKKDYEG